MAIINNGKKDIFDIGKDITQTVTGTLDKVADAQKLANQKVTARTDLTDEKKMIVAKMKAEMGKDYMDPAKSIETHKKKIAKDLKPTERANNYYNREDIAWYDKFARFSYLDPYNGVNTTREYVFFTKPDLHIYEPRTRLLNPEISNMPIFADGHRRFPKVMEQLQMSVNDRTDFSPFVNLLTNATKSSLELPQINANTTETAQNIYGTVMGYRQSSEASDNAHEFTLEFEETKYLEVYMFFK